MGGRAGGLVATFSGSLWLSERLWRSEFVGVYLLSLRTAIEFHFECLPRIDLD